MDQITLKLMEAQIKQIELLSQVLLSTRRQKEYIEKGDVETLISEIDKRQRSLDELLLLNKELEALKLNGACIITGTRLQQMEGEIKRLCCEIEELNYENNQNAQKKLNEYRNNIADLRKRKKVFKSYAYRFIREDGIYFDKKK